MPTWYQATVTKILTETPRVKRIWMSVDNPELPMAVPGQFITFDLPVGEKRLQRWKSYSIANVMMDNTIEICVGKMEGGLASTYLCDQVQLGDTLRFKGPEGGFVLPESLPSRVVFICTGTGIVPFRAMLHKVLGHPAYAHIHFHLIFGTRTEADILYRDDIATFQQFDNFSCDIALSRYTGDGLYHKGYVHAVYMSHYHNDDRKPLFMLCGWQAMIDQAVLTLQEKMLVDRSQIKVELYG